MSVQDALTALAIKTSLRLLFKAPSRLPVPLASLRHAMDQSSALLRVNPEAEVSEFELDGISGEFIAAPHAARVIIHLHGGAFFAGSTRTHRAFASHLAVRANAGVFLPNYRLAPEHPWPAALQDSLAIWDLVRQQGYEPERIVLSGDSAGGTHALNLALALRDNGETGPAGMVLVSPFLDLRLSNPSVRALARKDPMLTAHTLKRGADAYRGNHAVDDPRISPILADFFNLPPTLVQTGADEILLDDARFFAERARAAGVNARCQVFENMWHDFQIFHGLIPEADLAIEDMGSFIRQVTPMQRSD